MYKHKRDRSVNFNIQERDLLVAIVKKHEDIIESKKSDAVTWRNKESAWNSIEAEFNARSIQCVMRSSKTLRIKYEGLKRTVRKKYAAEFSQVEGGKNESTQLDRTEEIIKNMIITSAAAEGVECVYDPDVLPQPTSQTQPEFLDMTSVESMSDSSNSGEIEIKKEIISNGYDSWPTAEQTTAVKTDKDADEDIKITPDEINEPAPKITPDEINESAPSKPLQRKWCSTNRNKLKMHPSLTACKCKMQNSRLNGLAQAKLSLIQRQKELLEAEIIEKKKEWVFNKREREWKEEEYKLKLKKLRNELLT